MANRLIWSDRSLTEYDDLIAYLFEHWSEEIALRVMLEIDQTVLHIQTSPEHFPFYSKKRKIKRCVASPQTSIYFKVYDDTLEILTIFDNRQSPRKLKL
jgi:plasmid stabilization system protein ParE